MNAAMEKVILTNEAKEQFQVEKVFIRGNNVKMLKFASAVLDEHRENHQRRQAEGLEAKLAKKRLREDSRRGEKEPRQEQKSHVKKRVGGKYDDDSD